MNEVERLMCKKIGYKNSMAPSFGTAAIHLAEKRTGERLYGQLAPNKGTLKGHKVKTV